MSSEVPKSGGNFLNYYNPKPPKLRNQIGYSDRLEPVKKGKLGIVEIDRAILALSKITQLNQCCAIRTQSSLRSSMAEQRTLNATVGGSTPLVGTHFIPSFPDIFSSKHHPKSCLQNFPAEPFTVPKRAIASE